MELDIIDYLLTAIAVVVFPIWGVLDYRRFQRKVAQGGQDARVNHYRLAIAVEWIVTGVVLVAWLARGRGLGSLGLGFQVGTWFWVGAGLTLAAVGFLIGQAAFLTRRPEKLGELRKQLGDLEPLLPHDRREASVWWGLSLTAGICEEIFYRGFLIAVLAVATSTWVAVLVAAVICGLGHAYQGPKGILKTGLIGLVLGVLFVLTGSLWAPILVHAILDLTSGHLGRRAIQLTTDGVPALAT